MGGTSLPDPELGALAEPCLDWLAGDVEELARFMADCGYTPSGLRQAMGSRALAVALIEYFARNEPQLLAMTAHSEISVSALMRAYWRLNPGGG